MRQILAPIDALASLCRPRKFRSDEPYRFSTLCFRQQCTEGVLLYHTLTGEMLLLSEEELARLDNDGEDRKTLAEKSFLVPQSFHETEFVEQVRHITSLMHKKKDPITSFTVFTTMECNAHCFYCFENGQRRRPMSDETAHAVGEYIVRMSKGEHVKLTWFGGEPLYRRQVIGIIIGVLRENKVPFHSLMVTNGFLFDRDTIREAVEDWKLKLVQITLDGTEEVYNRTKAYDRAEGSPYRRVLQNISYLLKAGVKVRVRLNLLGSNVKNMDALVDELAAYFPERKLLDVYPALVREDTGVLPDWGWEEALAAYRALNARLLSMELHKPKTLDRRLKRTHCQADNDSCLVVLPGGELGKCEHYSDTEFVGSIFSDGLDEERIASWKERVDPVAACESCPCYPLCVYLKKCNWLANTCTELDRQMRLDELKEQVLQAYSSAGSCEETEENNLINC